MTVVDDIRTIQDSYPDANVGVSVQKDFVVVTVQPLPVEVFPARDTREYPNGTYVLHGDSSASVTSFRYADKDVDAAVAAALAVVQGVAV
ncbi:hypothetical protein AB4Z39_31620 [Mycobacterium adipatum]|uniref:hypothetical protein n=1 Tax=Mycobacterium adipatum TaxID=1682113 RepID=UPI0034E062A7